jgi:uncharacterized protein YfcZ (UPF0381/DUF406 family)
MEKSRAALKIAAAERKYARLREKTRAARSKACALQAHINHLNKTLDELRKDLSPVVAKKRA